jgi:hypothetical protein
MQPAPLTLSLGFASAHHQASLDVMAQKGVKGDSKEEMMEGGEGGKNG